MYQITPFATLKALDLNIKGQSSILEMLTGLHNQNREARKQPLAKKAKNKVQVLNWLKFRQECVVTF